MATIKEKFDGLQCTFTASAREYDCTYLVRGIWAESDFPATFVWTAKGLSDPYAVRQSVNHQRQLNATLAEVVAHYSCAPKQSKTSAKDVAFNPLSRTVRRSWSTGYIEVYPPADLDGKAFAVSTGEPIRGGVPMKVPYLIRRYVRNEAYFNENLAMTFIWAMNASKKTLCTKFDAGEQLKDEGSGQLYYEVSYEFWSIPTNFTLTWEEKRLDAGSYWLEEDDEGEMKPAYLSDKDKTKAYADGAILLNGSGSKWEDPANPKWNTFRVNRIANFAVLGLPGLY